MSSRPFNARNTSGTCYFCELNSSGDTAITAGDRVLYLTARAVNGAPGRPLNRRELRIWRELGREKKQRRRERRPAPKPPEWLWDRLVHVDCARQAGFPIPGGEASPIDGRRWKGWGDGTQVVGKPTTPKPSADRLREYEAKIAADRDARREAARVAREALAEREARYERNRVLREVEEQRLRDARKVAQDKAEAFEALKLSNPSAARFQLLDMDDAPSAPVAEKPDEIDPSVERFKLLDLD